MISTADLDKYHLDGVYTRHNIHGFFLLNIEATLYLFVTGIITHLVITLIKTPIVKPDTKEEDLNIITKAIVNKQEAFMWDGFPRQLMIYSIQALLFSLLQM